jgi:hypothetical protein
MLADVARFRRHAKIVTQRGGKKKSGEHRTATDVFAYSCGEKEDDSVPGRQPKMKTGGRKA